MALENLVSKGLEFGSALGGLGIEDLAKMSPQPHPPLRQPFTCFQSFRPVRKA